MIVLASPRWPRFLSEGLHRTLALTSLVFLAFHIVTSVVDPFTALGWTSVVIPFSAAYRRLFLGLGSVAMYLLIAVAITSRRPRCPNRPATKLPLAPRPRKAPA